MGDATLSLWMSHLSMIISQFVSLEPESVNECTLEHGSLFSFGATVLYILLSCLVSNLPASPGQRDENCFVFTSWKSESTSNDGSNPAVISTSAHADPEVGRRLETKEMETQQEADSLNQLPEQAPRSTEVLVKGNPETFQDEEAENEEIVEEEVVVIEEEYVVEDGAVGEEVVQEEHIYIEEEVVEMEVEVGEDDKAVAEGGDAEAANDPGNAANESAVSPPKTKD